MSAFPLFVESDLAFRQQVGICAEIRRYLFKKKFTLLPYATNLKELIQLTDHLKKEGRHPSIFVVNTFGSKDLLPELDRRMGSSPAVYLRRSLMKGQSGLLEQLAPTVQDDDTVDMVGKITPRPSVFWYFGSTSLPKVAESSAQALALFLDSGDFRYIENNRSAKEASQF